MEHPSSGFFKLALAWFVHFPLVSKFLLFFGVFFLICGLFGWLTARPIFSFRLMCLGLCWDYFFRFRFFGMKQEEYHDGTLKRDVWVEWPRVIGGLFFLALALVPSRCLVWLYLRLSI